MATDSSGAIVPGASPFRSQRKYSHGTFAGRSAAHRKVSFRCPLRCLLTAPPRPARGRRTVPSAACPLTNQFSQKSCKSRGNALHCSLQTPFAPAALPQLDTLRPMKTVCPSYQYPPTMPSAPPRFLPSHAASVHLPNFRQSPFFVRLRSSRIVWDRLRSSQIVRAHRRPSPAIPAELPKGSPDSVRQTGKKALQNASFRVKIRPGAPEAKNSARLARTIPKFNQPDTTEYARRQSRNGHQRPTRSASTSVRRNFFSG